ncbi:hypothetical protein F2Q69_00027023 [Brassica cretica]|uniref:RNase H type-1 domain-containing protein n=1 Tax=Brassica cretica TaxID=69181 RepID=A0A8S9RXN1_BRACR|nr:hypothetical protein F2Q69_00027023 [Brassica cretica]
MALQYISHADETERRARILRVQQSIEEDKNKTPTLLAKISHDVNKEKGHVFSYDMPHSEGFPLVGKPSRHAMSARSGDHTRASQAGSSSGESNNFHSVPMGPMVFLAGALGSTSTEILRNKKKSRQRPPAWVQHVRPNQSVTHKDQVVSDKLEGDSGPSKRKAEETELSQEALKSSLLRVIGDGDQTNVWTSNWLLEKEARPPMYKQDSIVDLTLKVRDLWFPNTQVWNAQKVFDTFTEEDALKILTIKPASNRQDSDLLSNDHPPHTTTASPNAPHGAWEKPPADVVKCNVGLLRVIGDGDQTNVWTSNWLLEKEARPPMYKQDSIVDLTLKVRDLWFPNTQVWNAQKVFDTFTEEDALKILSIKPAPNRQDSDVWGFTKNGIYTTQSMAWEAPDHISGSSWIVRDCQGQALHHSRQDLLGSSSKTESDLRSLLWAVQAMGDLRHKRVFFEASSIEVRESLLNPYRCPTLSSLILKILELLYCFEKWTIFHVSGQKNKVAKTIAESVISGSRVQSYVASGIFERNRITPHSTIAKALDETEIWYQLLSNDHPPHTTTASPNAPHGAWEKPPADVVKCNVGMAWEAPDHISGSSWIVRDCQGKSLHHSRQTLLFSSSKTKSDLRSLLWAVQVMGDLRHKKVFFEASSVEVRESLLNPYRCPTLSSLILKILELLYCFEKWTIFHVSDQKNKVAKTIAESVISGSRVQSYVASGSPRWLHQMILEDTRSV